MREEKCVVTLDSQEQRLMVKGLTGFRNDAIREGKPTEDVDDLILKVIDAPPNGKGGGPTVREDKFSSPGSFSTPAALSPPFGWDCLSPRLCRGPPVDHQGVSRGDKRPFSYHTLRGQFQNCPHFYSVLRAGHRCLPLHRPQLPQAGRTRQRQVGQSRRPEQEVRQPEDHREQNTHAKRGYRAGRAKAPAQSQHFMLRRLRRGQDPVFRQAQCDERQHQLCVPGPQGELLRDTGNLLKTKGYDIKVIDLINMEKSHCYNPFVYLRNDNDIQRLVTNLFKNTTPKGSQSQDPFLGSGGANAPAGAGVLSPL